MRNSKKNFLFNADIDYKKNNQLYSNNRLILAIPTTNKTCFQPHSRSHKGD